jgi:hypothetical protein
VWRNIFSKKKKSYEYKMSDPFSTLSLYRISVNKTIFKITMTRKFLLCEKFLLFSRITRHA